MDATEELLADIFESRRARIVRKIRKHKLRIVALTVGVAAGVGTVYVLQNQSKKPAEDETFPESDYVIIKAIEEISE